MTAILATGRYSVPPYKPEVRMENIPEYLSRILWDSYW